jgi:O-antigen ligase
MMGAAGLLLFLSGALPWFVTQAGMTGGDAGSDRLDYTRVAFHVMQTHPLTGIGLNNFGRALYIPVHNTFLQFASETGVVGGLIFAALVAHLFILSWNRARTAVGDPEARLWLKGLALGMVAVVTQFMMEPLYTGVVSWTFFGLVAAGAIIHHPRFLFDGGGSYEPAT